MTMQAIRSHLHQVCIHTAALEAVIADLDAHAIPEQTLELAMHELADVENRLDGLADRLSEAFNPLAAANARQTV